MKKIFICTFLIVLFATLSFAQNQTSTDYNKREFFAGYSENSSVAVSGSEANDSLTTSSPYRGWNTSVNFNLNRYLGIKTDVSGHYRSETLFALPVQIKANFSTHNFMGGIQIKDNKKTKRFSPFIHALGGISTNSVKISSNYLSYPLKDSKIGFTAVIGAGIDLKVKKNISIRLIQIDYNPAFYSGFTEHRIRAGFGIVFH